MPSTNELRRPLYAAAGAGDLAVEKLLWLSDELSDQAHKLFQQAREVDREGVRSRVGGYADRAGGYVSSQAAKAADFYGDLVVRGEQVIERIRKQEASHRLTDQLAFTRRQVKATRTSASKGVAQTRRQVKSTATAARKTGAAAAEAVADAADKVG